MFGLSPMELMVVFLIFLIVIIIGVIFLVRALLRTKKPNYSYNQSERLKELQKMKNDDLITEDEFNKKRNEILNSL